MEHTNPILITGVPRSGATFIARILEMCAVQKGLCTGMYENIPLSLSNSILFDDIPKQQQVRPKTYQILQRLVNKDIERQEFIGPWMFKSSGLTPSWRYWNKMFPNATWVVIRRKSPYIINSCEKTAWMTLMKDKNILNRIGCKTEREGWKWLIHFYENEWGEMLREGIKFFEVYPDRMLDNDYTKIEQLITDLGLQWTDKVISTMSPYFTEEKKG